MIQDFHYSVPHEWCAEYASVEQNVRRSGGLTAEKVRQMPRNRWVGGVRKAKFGKSRWLFVGFFIDWNLWQKPIGQNAYNVCTRQR